jgi:hypothetical protein
VLGHGLHDRLAGRLRRRGVSAERQVEDRQRQLRVILRQPLSFLPEQAAFESLDLLLQQAG